MTIQFYNKGNPEQISGGYLYNKYIIATLEQLGAKVEYLNHPEEAKETAIDIIVIDSLMIYELEVFILETDIPIVLLMHLPPDVFLELEEKTIREKEALKQIYKKSSIIVTGTRSQTFLQKNYATATRRLHLLEPGMLPDWQQKTNYPVLPTKLICIANLVKGKGHLRLLDTLALLQDLNWTLELYGNSDFDKVYFQEVVNKVAELGVQERVFYRGCVAHKEINKVLKKSDLMLHLSEYETYSMVTAEAINTKLPVISSRSGAYERFEASGFVHYLQANEYRAIANEIRPVISDSNRYKRLRTGINKPPKTWDEVGQAFYDILKNRTGNYVNI